MCSPAPPANPGLGRTRFGRLGGPAVPVPGGGFTGAAAIQAVRWAALGTGKAGDAGKMEAVRGPSRKRPDISIQLCAASKSHVRNHDAV